ncbi:MAG: phage portal protein, partial [Alphaproteobacteria bacterium]
MDYSGSSRVTVEEALSLPAVWAAVNFLASTMASLPLQVYRTTRSGRSKYGGPPAPLLRMAPNPWQTSYDWRHMMFTSLFTAGRALSWIERDGSGRVVAIWPLPLDEVVVRRSEDRSGRVQYVRGKGRAATVYEADEVIDLAFLRTADGLGHYGPIDQCGGAIRQALNARAYALTIFGARGIPPFVITGPFQSGEAARRAADDVARAAARAMADGRPAIALPAGHDIKRIMDSPDKMQLVEAQKYAVTEIARVYGLPPVFLQDL